MAGSLRRRRGFDLVLAAGVAALVAVAIVRGGSSSDPEPGATEPAATEPAATEAASLEATEQERDREILVRQLAAAASALKGTGIAGVLYLTDEVCHVSALALPGLEQVAPPLASACRFGVTQRAPVGMDEAVETMPGADVPVGTGLRSPRLVQSVVLEDGRTLAVIRGMLGGERAHALALVERGQASDTVAFDTSELQLVRLGARDGLVALRDGVGVLHVVRVGQKRLEELEFPPWTPPAPTDILSVAWSPDEVWTAVTTRRAVYLYRTEAPELGATGIPVVAADVDWRRAAS